MPQRQHEHHHSRHSREGGNPLFDVLNVIDKNQHIYMIIINKCEVKEAV